MVFSTVGIVATRVYDEDIATLITFLSALILIASMTALVRCCLARGTTAASPRKVGDGECGLRGVVDF